MNKTSYAYMLVVTRGVAPYVSRWQRWRLRGTCQRCRLTSPAQEERELAPEACGMSWCVCVCGWRVYGLRGAFGAWRVATSVCVCVYVFGACVWCVLWGNW